MVTTTLPKIEGPSVTSLLLEDRGLFGPPLGEPLDGPMPTAGLQLWISSDGTVRTGGNAARAASARPLAPTRASSSGS